MVLIVYSKSNSFNEHLRKIFDFEINFRSQLSEPMNSSENLYIVHTDSFLRELPKWLLALTSTNAKVATAADTPNVADMLGYTESGVLAYFNSYMADTHYSQLVRLMTNGQSWFPPALMQDALGLARTALSAMPTSDPMELLTKREREIALAVAAGLSNKLVAEQCGITERTVKAHMTQIFKKLEIKDRVALVIYLNRFESIKSHVKTMA